MNAIRRVLVPIDFAESSDAAVDAAVELARAFDAKLTLLNVYDVSIYLHSAGPFMPIVDTTKALEENAKKATAMRLAEVKSKYANVDAIVRCGQPWEEILAATEEQRADLVVMGTHGRDGLPHFLLGSVAERVVRMSKVPVLTVRGTR